GRGRDDREPGRGEGRADPGGRAAPAPRAPTSRSPQEVSMSFGAGVDVGSTQTKAVIVDASRRIVAPALIDTGANVSRAAENGFARACEPTGLPREAVGYVVGTGYGRYKVTFGDAQITEITCHARGAHSLFPGTRTVVDMGGQDTKAIKVAA